MNYKYSLIVLVAAVVVSCTKDGANDSNTFLVSASKMIAIKGHVWDEVEPQLKKRRGTGTSKRRTAGVMITKQSLICQPLMTLIDQ
jgi:hypothetical protein